MTQKAPDSPSRLVTDSLNEIASIRPDNRGRVQSSFDGIFELAPNKTPVATTPPQNTSNTTPATNGSSSGEKPTSPK